jgi:hypothetical protein
MSNKTIMWLRLEGAVVLIAALYFFAKLDYSWWFFAVFILLFDVSAIGYLKDKRFGALTYNAGHSYVLPILLLILGWQTSNSTQVAFSIVWFAHIGMDRAAGYGLKTEKGFRHTHLGLLNHVPKR